MNDRIKRLSAVGLGTLLAVAATLGAALSTGAEEKPAVAVWTPWKGFGLLGAGRPAVERDPTGRLQVFVRVPPPTRVIAPDSLWHIRQSGRADPPWRHWEELGGSLQGDPVVGKSYDGRLEVFGRGTSGTLQHIAQTDGVNDQWAPWESLDGVTIVGNPAVASNADGRLEVFAAVATSRTEFTLWHIWQTGSSVYPFWSGWENLGGHLLGTPVVGRNRDGCLEVFARAAGNNLARIWQTSTSDIQWSEWEDLGGGALVGNPVVGANADGRLEVFTRAADKAVWHIWQTAANSGWSSWASLGGAPMAGDPVVGIDLDGRLELFVRGGVGPDPSLWYTRQTGSFSRSWSYWENLNGQLSSDPAVGTNGDGRLELFVLAVDRGVYHIWQQPPVQWVLGSTAPMPMAAGDRIPGLDLGASTMHDGTLYIFFGDGPPPEYSDPIGYLHPTGGAAEGSQGDDFSLDRDASKDFAGFDYLREPGLFSSLYPVPFRLDTSLGPQTLGQDQTPTGAFSYNHTVYVFAYAGLLPSGAPSQYPNQIPAVDPMGVGQSFLTSSADPVGPTGPFHQIFTLGPPLSSRRGISFLPQMTDKFNQVAPWVVKNAEIPGLPKTDTPDGLIMLGQGGDGPQLPAVYAAWMPLRPGQDPRLSELRFYKGNTDPNPEHWWSANAWEAKPLFQTKYFWSSLSLGRIRSTGRWIVLYQKTLADFQNEDPSQRHDGIYARIGATPWDWSPEVTIFDPDRERAWGSNMVDEPGGFAYGAFLLNPYTNWDAANRKVTIKYLMSPGSPYGVMLMRSEIQLND